MAGSSSVCRVHSCLYLNFFHQYLQTLPLQQDEIDGLDNWILEIQNFKMQCAEGRCVCVFVCVCKSIFTFMHFLICCSEFVFLHHSYMERITALSQQRTILELLFDKADDVLLLCSGEVQRRNTIYFSSLYFLISSNSWCKLGWIIGHSIYFLRIMISAKVILELWFFPMKYPSWMDQRSILFLELLQLDLLTVSFPSGYF